jgi:hypothetical protein
MLSDGRARRNQRLHLTPRVGVEDHLVPLDREPLGVELGPSIVWTGGKPHIGLSLYTYTSIVLVPNVGGRLFLDASALGEIGMLFKIPSRTPGKGL